MSQIDANLQPPHSQTAETAQPQPAKPPQTPLAEPLHGQTAEPSQTQSGGLPQPQAAELSQAQAIEPSSVDSGELPAVQPVQSALAADRSESQSLESSRALAGMLPPPPAPARTPVLERLGSSPFPRGKFPFLGILASIYEHVGEVTRRRYNPGP